MAQELDDLKDALRDRLKSPLYGSWLIAFSILNWRAIYILFFPSKDVEFIDRLQWVDTTLYSHFWPDHVVKLLLGPLLLACVAVAGVPWFINALDWVRYQAFVQNLNIKKNIDGDLLDEQKKLTLVKSELKSKVEELERFNKNFEELKSAHNRAVQELKKTNENYLDKLAILVRSHPSFRNIMSHSHGSGMFDWKTFDIDDVMVLVNLGLIENKSEMHRPLTPLGVAVFKRAKL